MSRSLVYFWQIADNICLVLTGLLFACIAGYVISLVASTFPFDDPKTQGKILGQLKKFLWVPITLALLKAFIPTSNQLAIIYVVPEIANSKVIQQDVPEIYNMAVGKLKDALKDIPDVKTEEKKVEGVK